MRSDKGKRCGGALFDTRLCVERIIGKKKDNQVNKDNVFLAHLIYFFLFTCCIASCFEFMFKC